MKRMVDILKRWVSCVVGAWLLVSCGAMSPRWKPVEKVVVPEPREGVPRVLFVGNSFSFGVPRVVAEESIREGSRWDVGRVTRGGWTLEKHVENPETLAAIRNGKWDVVVLQEQSRIPSVPWQRKTRMIPAARKLAAEVRAAGAVPVFYQTWGYRGGDEWRKGDDFAAMNARLREGYGEAGETLGMQVVPVGDAWEREVRAGRGGRLFDADGKHPSEAGDEVTARVFLERLAELRKRR
ncbi:MAG: SGNH/GDSL hydrolase family protein [Akkermansiaceae bacterium]|nr:SGNH/GDSL hydrolase family protein [Akkermansiaceae bacterium]